MERALRLEVASQKSLHGVYDGLAEKSMRRFSMVACYHFKRIAPGARIWAWKEPEPQGYLVTYYDVGNHPVWMTLWSTELPSGNGERLWWETERFARDFNRDTVLVSEDEQGVVCYRFYSPDRGARAWVRVAPDGSSVTGEQTEQFFQGLVKRWRRGALELEAVHFEERTQACAWLDDAFGFQPREMPERRSVLKAAARNALKSPFHVMPLVRDKAYLDYDPKAEYEKVLQAAQGLLAPSGFHKSKSNFYRLWEGGTYMECIQFQRNWMRPDPTQETIFTVNIGWGAAAHSGRERWAARDLTRGAAPCSRRIGHLTRGYDHWYELYPGVDTVEVVETVMSDLKKAVAYLDQCRTSG